nr:AAA family ATPase [uncultured Psychrobacter sp.]
MNHNQLSSLSITGFKSIKSCNIEMTNLNVLIGANGSGKSNFIGFFKFIHELLDENLQSYTSKSGGPDSILHFGRKSTEHLKNRATIW